MRDEFGNIKFLLIEWGDHHRKYGDILGFSGESIESRMMQYGGATSGSALRVIPGYKPSKRVKSTDTAIQGLTRYYRDMIKYKYMEQRTEDECFALANLGRTKYYTELKVIYAHVGAWLHFEMR